MNKQDLTKEKEAISAYNKQYYAKNKETILARMSKNKQEIKDKLDELQRLKLMLETKTQKRM